MDQRANSAQLASRNIKSAKGRRKGPVQANGVVQQSMSFGPPDSGGGGLFGGSVQAPGTFQFAASGPSFPPTPFNNPFGNASSADASESEDPRADTTGEEAARRNKTFQSFREEPKPNPAARNSSSFGQTTPFGQTQQNAANNPFNFVPSPQLNTSGNFTQGHGQPGNTFSLTPQPAAFGSAFKPSQSTGNTFSPFGQTAAHPSSILASGSPSTQDRPSTSFFGQPAAHPTSGFAAGSPSIQNRPATSVFSQPSSTNFGSSISFNSNIFANPASDAMSDAGGDHHGNNLFGGQSHTQNNNDHVDPNQMSDGPEDAPASHPPNLFAPPHNRPTTTQPFTGGSVFGTSSTTQPNPFSLLSSASNQPTTLKSPFSLPQPSTPNYTSSDTPNYTATSTPSYTAVSTTAAPFAAFGQQSNMFATPQPTSNGPNNTPFTKRPSLSDPETYKTTAYTNPASPQYIPDLFSAPNNPQTSTSRSAVSNPQQPSISNNVFGAAKPPEAASSKNVFGLPGNQPAAFTPSSTPSNIFGQISKSADPAIATSSNNNTTSAPEKLSVSAPSGQTSIFGSSINKQAAPTTNLFGTLNKPVDESVALANANGKSVDGATMNGAATTTTTNQKSSLFTQASSSNLFGTPAATNSTLSSQSETPSASANPLFSLGNTSNSVNANGSSPPTKLVNPTMNGSKAASSIFSLAVNQSNTPTTSNMFQPSSTVPGPISLSNGNMTNKADTKHLVDETAPTDEFLQSIAPKNYNGQQKKEFFIAYRLRSLNKTIADFLSTVPVGVEISTVIEYFNQKRAELLGSSPMPANGSKRKAAGEGQSEDESRNKRPKAFESTDTSKPLSPQKTQTPPSPEERATTIINFHQPINGIPTPIPALPPPPSFSAEAASLPSPSPKSKRKATEDLDKDSYERGRKRLDMGESTTGSATSNMIKGIIEKDASPGKKVKSLPVTSKEEAPKANPFGVIPVPSSPAALASAPSNLFGAQAATTSSNVFQSKSPVPAAANIFTSKADNASVNVSSPTVPAVPSTMNIFGAKTVPTTSNVFQPKPPTSAPAPTNMFVLNANTTSSSVSSPPMKSTITPPNFGNSGPVNFLAQFAADSEKVLMEKAKDEDYDSDDGPVEEWEAKWKAARKEKLAQNADSIRNFQSPSWAPGKGFSFTPKKDSGTASAQATPKSQEEGNQDTIKPVVSNPGTPRSIFDSVNNSRVPSPSPTDKDAFKNPFAHLTPTPASAEEDDDTDDESGDEHADADAENKDPSKENSGPTSTVREPTKRGPIFSFGGQKTGLSDPSKIFNSPTPPSGGLFDRIQRDANGNPVRQLPSDEKENTEPNATKSSSNTSIFGTPMGKSYDGATDQTWKKDSPIRFGSATPNNETGTPVFSVTAATPTKTPAPFSNLFGNSTTPKAPLPSSSVGFNFSAPPSNLSSLLPSAAASASTSRATTPGATTDGDSAVEGDPDAEKHEQINLSAGGPGEEDEEVVHEVRARATLWIADKKAFVVQGVGILRLLENEETKATRMLLRADPSGKIVLNKALLSQNYEAVKKTVSFLAAPEKGDGLEKWILQVKTEEMATYLAKVLNASKP